jgi:single-stranded-DNA-specific exonuclease
MTTAGQVIRPESRWRLHAPQAQQDAIPRFPPIVATVLAARDITTREEAETFYKPHLLPPHDPLLLPGMAEAIERTKEAIAGGELIALFGDFDVDGVTSLAVLSQAFDELGAKTTTYIPNRFTEGYGLNNEAVATLAKRGVTLMLTADCGTSSVEEVAAANRAGMDVIILDHHTVHVDQPDALALINPKRDDSPYPFREMAAVGVSYRFLQALFQSLGRELDESAYVDLVAFGTVADVAPLVDENRAMVVAGLKQMAESMRPGMEALADVSRVAASDISAETFGFAFGPRVNAAGRLAHADTALDLLLSKTRAEAARHAQTLDSLNQQRRENTDEAYALAEELCGASDDPLIMIGHERMNMGIVGIVAARLAEQHNKPAIVFERGESTSRASCRSVADFDIVKAIRTEENLLVRHGGHRAAAGFTIANKNIDEFRARMVNYAAERLDGRDPRPVIDIDADVRLQDLSGLEVRGLKGFEPCGEGNPKPVLLSRNVEVQRTRRIGADQSHLKLTLRDGPVSWQAVAFRQADSPIADRIDIVYSLGDEWQGRGIELVLADFAPSEQGHPLEFG